MVGIGSGRISGRLAGLVLAGGLAGCATMMVGSDFSALTDFGPYRSYAWEARDSLPTGDPRLDSNPFFDERVRTGVDSVLAGKGYRLVERGSAALTLHWHFRVQQKLDYYQVDTERGYQSSQTQVRDYQEGTLLLDIADASGRRIVWRGWAQTDITGVIDDQARMGRRIGEAVGAILTRFPPA